jgi:hypothetical protein
MFLRDVLMPDEGPRLYEPQPTVGNGWPTFDASAPAVLWIMAPDRRRLRVMPREDITQISVTLEELLAGACGLMKSGHTAIIVHSGGVWLPGRIREAAEELK